MQLFSIENLSLAAEVTVVLLLIAFALPQKTVQPVQEASEGKTMSWEPAKHYFLRFCMLRGLYLKHFRVNHENGESGPGEPYISKEMEDDPDRPSVPAPWHDRLTHLLNRHGFDAVLKEWMALDPHHRGDSCISMVTASSYSDLVTTHGAMITEQAIQRIASQLALSLSDQAIVAKYLPDRFVVLHFATQLANCHKTFEAVQQSIAEVGFFQVAGEPLSLPCSISIVPLSGDSTAHTKIDELDEGIVEAQQSGRSILSRVDDNWTEAPPASEPTAPLAKPIDSVSQAEIAPNSSMESNGTASIQRAPDQDAQSSSTATIENQSQIDDSSSASNDISAVANADDIAALFAQINSNKANKSQENQKQADQIPADAVQAATADSAISIIPVDKSEAASADDIAALFASMKPNATSAPVAKASTTAPVAAATASKPAEEIDPSEAASADDITALFAAIKPNAPKAPVPSVPKSSAETKQVVAPTTTPTTTLIEQSTTSQYPARPVDAEDLNEAATADNIAALFATVKSGLKPTPPAEPASAKLNSPIPSAVPVAAVSAQAVSTADPASPPVPTGDQLAEVATADDIAMLFQSVKPKASQPAVAKVPVIETQPVVATTPASPPAQPASAPKIEMDLASNASSDDIAALFASMKK